MRHVTKYIPQLKLENFQEYSPIFQNCTCCERYNYNVNKHNSLQLTLKICSHICPCGYYLFLKVHETYNVRSQISEHIPCVKWTQLFTSVEILRELGGLMVQWPLKIPEPDQARVIVVAFLAKLYLYNASLQ